MEILFLTTVLPGGLSSGGEIASQSVVDALAGHGHGVTVVGYRREGDPPHAGDRVVEAGARPIETSAAGVSHKAAWMAGALIHRLPYSAAKYRSSGYANVLRRELAGERFDLAIVDHAQIGWVQPYLRDAGLPFAALLHNVEHRLYAERADGAPLLQRAVHAREARRVRALEDGLARAAAAVWVLADEDAEYFARFGEVRTLRLPSPVRVEVARVAKQRDIALIGTWSWDITRRGLEWFLDRVRPLLPQDVNVVVAGRGGEWVAGVNSGVSYDGVVPDAAEFLASARVVAVPSLGGTGVQVKTLDAIASGSHVVATAAGVRGLGKLPPSVRVADTPEQFAAEISAAVRSPESLEPSGDALRWTAARRERFAADVAAAVEAAARP